MLPPSFRRGLAGYDNTAAISSREINHRSNNTEGPVSTHRHIKKAS
jgi:hypothetical protein